LYWFEPETLPNGLEKLWVDFEVTSFLFATPVIIAGYVRTAQKFILSETLLLRYLISIQLCVFGGRYAKQGHPGFQPVSPSLREGTSLPSWEFASDFQELSSPPIRVYRVLVSFRFVCCFARRFVERQHRRQPSGLPGIGHGL
jgi:hypothetical protein